MPKVPAARTLACSNCRRPLRTLTLSGHYQGQVEIDVCDPCCLIWFDGTESVRIAGEGVAGLVEHIHQAMLQAPLTDAVGLQRQQHCPMCGAPLKQVYNQSRFGRTRQLQCPLDHGYYQTYVLYLAEKGYIRPIQWSDIATLAGRARALYCANCGASLALRPQDACPHCHSAIAVLDPARLASAIDRDHLPPVPAPQREQAHCAQCGGPLDPTVDVRCPHCAAVVTRDDSANAAKIAAWARERAQAAPSGAHTQRRFAAMDAMSEAHDLGENVALKRLSGFRARLAAALLVFIVLMGFYLSSRNSVGDARSAPARAARYVNPVMRCDPQAAQRSQVVLRQIIVPIESDERAPSAQEARAALLRIGMARREWQGGADYAKVLSRFVYPEQAEAAGDSRWRYKSQLHAVIGRAAFCLPLGEISEPLLVKGDFYLVQVSQAR